MAPITKSNRKQAEIIYRRLNSIISQIPQKSKDYSYVEDSIVRRFHRIVDEATNSLGKNYMAFKIPEEERKNFTRDVAFGGRSEYYWDIIPVRTRIYEFAAAIGAEYELDKESVWGVLRQRIVAGLKQASLKLIIEIVAGILVAIIVSYLALQFGLHK